MSTSWRGQKGDEGKTKWLDKSKQTELLQHFFKQLGGGGPMGAMLAASQGGGLDLELEPDEEDKPAITGADFTEDQEEEEPEAEGKPQRPQYQPEEPVTPEETPRGSKSHMYSGSSQFVKGMIARGWTPEEAAGVAGNVHVESGFKPYIKSSVPGEHSYGFLQWNKERLRGLQNMAAIQGRDWQDPEVQMDYIQAERSGDSIKFGGGDERNSYYKAFAQGGTPAEIAERFGRFVERPLRLADTVETRRKMAEMYLPTKIRVS